MADPSITRSTRTYILATLLATLAVTALIAMFVVILCPAHVTFVVTHASRSSSSKDRKLVSLHLSISTNTSQRHTKVKFESIFIDLLNSSGSLGVREDDWRWRFNAHVDKMPDDYLKYPGNTSISVSAAGPNSTFQDFAPDWFIDELGLTVAVMAQVHFKVGVVRTRLYGIRVYCDEVFFPNQNNKTASRAFTPVTCHN